MDDVDSRALCVALRRRRVRLAAERHAPRIGSGEAADDARERRLSGAVRAEEGVHLAGADVQVDASENGSAVALVEPANLQQRCGRDAQSFSAVTRSTGVRRSCGFACPRRIWSAYSIPNTASCAACWSAVASTRPSRSISRMAEMLSKPTTATCPALPPCRTAATAPSAMLSLLARIAFRSGCSRSIAETTVFAF